MSLVFVLIVALWGARDTLVEIQRNRGADIRINPRWAVMEHEGEYSARTNDDDSIRITEGLNLKPTFASTFRYWYGSWAGGDGPPTPFGPYYRPLSSQLWWLQRYFWGDNSLHLFLTVHLFWHLCFVAALWGLLRALWSTKIATLAVVIWVMGIAVSLNVWSIPHDALTMWKDDPEMTTGLGVLGAMAAILGFIRRQKKRYIALAALSFLLALSFKESGYIAPFFIGLVLWQQGKLRQYFPILLGFCAMALLCFAYRYWALGGMGGYHGTNGAWLQRWLMECLGGAIAARLIFGDGLALMIAALGICVWQGYRRKTKTASIWGGIAFLALVWTEYHSTTFGEGLWRLLDFTLYSNNVYFIAAQFVIVLLMFWLFVARHTRLMLFGYAWVVLAYIPLMRQAVTGHGFYIHSIGWALWLTAISIEAMRMALPHLRSYQEKLQTRYAR